jgi:hypothetical protein
MVVRGALENARTTLATIRRGRPGESGRGERLIVLRETADQMFGNLIALVETIEAIPPAARDRGRLDIVVAALRDVIRVLRELAGRVVEERQTGSTTVSVSGAPLLASLTTPMPDGNGSAEQAPDARYVTAQYEHAASLLDRIAQFASVAAANVAALDRWCGALGSRYPRGPGARGAACPCWRRCAPCSVETRSCLRHALRVAIVTAVAVWLAARCGCRAATG